MSSGARPFRREKAKRPSRAGAERLQVTQSEVTARV